MPIDQNILVRIKSNDPAMISLNINNQNLQASDIYELATALEQNFYLTTLDISGNPIGDEGAILLSQNSTLVSLIAIGTQINEKGAIALAKHQKLVSLDLSQNCIGDVGVIALAKNTLLTNLKVARNQITDAGACAFVDNSALISLDLRENELGDSGAIALAHNKFLIELLLTENQISDEGAIALAQHSKLTSLVLAYNKIGVKGAKALAKNTQLLSLDLNYNKVGIEGASALAKSTTLTSLFLIGNEINNMGIAELMKNKTITFLDLSYNQINDDSAIFLGINKTLKRLHISYNQLGVQSAKALAQHSNLQELSIRHNLLGDEGAIALAQSDSITWLDLTGNQLGPNSAKAFTNNTRLITLILSYNFMGNLGSIALALNKTLSELFLSCNEVGDEGAIALAQNQTLKTLNLNYNYIQKRGKDALIQNKIFKSIFISPQQPPNFTSENFNTIFLLSQDLFCIRGYDDTIQFFNPAFSRVLGYMDDELLGKRLGEFLHPDERINEVKQRIDEQKKFPISQRVNRYRCKDGSYRLIQWSSQARDGRIYASGIDITEQKKMENKLIETERQNAIVMAHIEEAKIYNRKQSDFIAHLCHEIRNPLQGIYGNLELIKEHFESLEKLLSCQYNFLSPLVKEAIANEFNQIKEGLRDTEICAEYEETILNDNLDVAKMAENKLQLTNTAFDIKDTIHQIHRMLKIKADKKKLALNMNLPEEELKVKGDKSRIKQIIINLTSNAIKFTAKGHVDISLTVQSRTSTHTQFLICVTDTGIGLTEQEISKLFARFSQASVTTSDQYGGSGLGLFIAKKLANLMSGDITVESQKGVGTIFSCIIQCENLLAYERNKEEAMTTPSQLATPLPKPFSRKAKILVVEDNEMNRRLLGNILTKNGYECLFAMDGKDALEKFSIYQADIILMDIVMPNLDGISTTQEIRKGEREKNLTRVPIIGLTGNAMEVQRKQAFEAGMDDYLTKPYKKEEILNRIAMLLAPNVGIEKMDLQTVSKSFSFEGQQTMEIEPRASKLTITNVNASTPELFSKKLSELEKNFEVPQKTGTSINNSLFILSINPVYSGYKPSPENIVDKKPIQENERKSLETEVPKIE